MLTDALGRTFDFPAPPKRVVSLVPSMTEVLFDLGVGDAVVGITSYCIFPSGIGERIPAVGGTKNPKIENIRELKPDLVYMNLEENLKRHGEAIEEFAPVFVTEPKNVPDVESLILQAGTIHRCVERAEALVSELAEELKLLRQEARPFTFAVPIWKKPWMWCGGDTYVSNLVSEAGGSNIFREHMRYPTQELEDLTRLHRPDVIFLPDEPYLFTAEDAKEIAASGANVIGPFAGHLFTWHGTRTIHGLRFLRQFLQQPA